MFFSLAVALMFQQEGAEGVGSPQCTSRVGDEASDSFSYLAIQGIHYKCELTNMPLLQNGILQSQQLIAFWFPSV